MSIPIYIIDAFAEKAFQGNPAAVCILDNANSAGDKNIDNARWMQDVAVEMNLSETAFVDLESRRLRWFTPGSEVDLCGHATVATATAMMHHGRAKINDVLQFETKSGTLSATLLEGSRIQLDFPATPCQAVDSEYSVEYLFEGDIEFVGKSKFDLLVELPSESDVRDFIPNFEKLKTAPYRGIIITAKSDHRNLDFVSRFFAPAVGVNEDPVTGSAHCCLAPYWGEKLKRSKMTAEQLSARGGRVEVENKGDRVLLTGPSVLIMKGELV